MKTRLCPWLIALLTLFPLSQTRAWNSGGAKEGRGVLKINGQNASETVFYFSELDLPGGSLYHGDAHIYILQHAVDLLRQDGHENWADLAGYNLLHLASGSKHADAYKGRIVIRLALDALWGLVELYHWNFDLTCAGGCEHYHNANSDNGLDLSGWSLLANNVILDQLVRLIQLMSPANFTFGLVDLDVDVIPEIRAQYPSGLKLCQVHYRNALEAWKGQYLYPDRTAGESALYELGWACHLMADLTVAQHLHNMFIGGHSDYEDFADGKGEAKEYHAASAKTVYRYAFANNDPDRSQPVGQLAYELVNKLSVDPDYLSQAEDGLEAERKEALKKAIPLAEQYTAAILAQFFNDLGIPDKIPPLEGYIRESGTGKTIPFAYVFYSPAGSTVQIEQAQPAESDPKKSWKGWDFIQADENGRYSLPIKKFTRYLVRPAMPGYSFKGRTSLNSEFGQPDVPVLYSPLNVSYSQDFMDFSLEPCPVPALSVKVTAPGKTAVIIAKPLIKQTPLLALRPALVSDKIRLSNAGSELSYTLANTIYRGVLNSRCNTNVLGTAGGNSLLPEEAVVTLQVSNLVSHSQARVVRSIAEVVQAADETRTQIIKAQLPKTAINYAIPAFNVSSSLKTLDRDKYLALRSLLPVKDDVSSSGKTIKVVSPSAVFAGNEGASLLLENGLLLIPAKSGVEIEVKADLDSGLLRVDGPPLRLVTDSAGAAVFRVRSGSHAGKIRLRYSVLKNPDALDIRPEGIIEIMAKPGLDPDPPAETRVKLEPGAPGMFGLAYAVSLNQTPPKSFHSVLEVSPQGIKEKGKATQVSAALASGIISISGQWNSNIGAVYDIQQNGNQYTWWARSLDQSGSGTISGNAMTMSGPGWTVRGTITEVDQAGKATKIVGENGVILFRTTGGQAAPLTSPAQPPAPSAPTAPAGGIISISGQWNSNIGAVYNIQQNGNQYTWTVPSLNQSGTGTISGKAMTMSGPGWTVRGTITEVDQAGKATKIVGENGVILFRR